MTQGRKDCRQGRKCEPRTVAEAIYCLVHHSDIEPRVLAERLGKRYAYLMDAANPDRDTVQFQIQMLIPAMQLTNNWMPLQFLCREMGGVFVPLPTVGAEHGDIRKAFMATIQEIGEDSAVIERVLADNIVTAEENRAVSDKLDRTIAALLRVKAEVDARAARPATSLLRSVGGQAR